MAVITDGVFFLIIEHEVLYILQRTYLFGLLVTFLDILPIEIMRPSSLAESADTDDLSMSEYKQALKDFDIVKNSKVNLKELLIK